MTKLCKMFTLKKFIDINRLIDRRTYKLNAFQLTNLLHVFETIVSKLNQQRHPIVVLGFTYRKWQ